MFEKMMTENLLNLERGKSTQVQEAQRVPIKMKPKKLSKTHHNYKCEIQQQTKNLKGSKGDLIRLAADF